MTYTMSLDSWCMTAPGALTTTPAKPRSRRAVTNPSTTPLREAFTGKYPEWVFILDLFKDATSQRADWKNLTKSNLLKFVAWMAERYAPNTVHQYCTRLKTVINIYSEDVTLPRNWEKLLSPKKVASTAIYLTEEELTKLQKYQPRSRNERFVRNMFLASAYCGARYVDIMRMNAANLQDGRIVFIAQKTHKQASIPLKPIVERYILDTPRVELSDVSYNKIIRQICRNVGIVEKVKILKAGKETELDKCDAVSSHTARRSFATNLSLRGVDIHTISKLMQHSDLKLTQKYICCDTRSLTDKELEYFA